jgi:GH15 family glucan-1,4-alpha-glucosidase
MSAHPIAEYALLSDCHSAALVHRMGSIDWLCFPRYDAPSVFGRLLDQTAGHWSIQVSNVTSIRRSYLEDTLVLKTEFETPGGRVTLTDALAVGANEGGHQLGVRSPHALLRRAECTEGQVELEMGIRAQTRVRPDGAHAPSCVRRCDSDGWCAVPLIDGTPSDRKRNRPGPGAAAGRRNAVVCSPVPANRAARLLD